MSITLGEALNRLDAPGAPSMYGLAELLLSRDGTRLTPGEVTVILCQMSFSTGTLYDVATDALGFADPVAAVADRFARDDCMLAKLNYARQCTVLPHEPMPPVVKAADFFCYKSCALIGWNKAAEAKHECNVENLRAFLGGTVIEIDEARGPGPAARALEPPPAPAAAAPHAGASELAAEGRPPVARNLAAEFDAAEIDELIWQVD